jgi:hypothetical protein
MARRSGGGMTAEELSRLLPEPYDLMARWLEFAELDELCALDERFDVSNAGCYRWAVKNDDDSILAIIPVDLLIDTWHYRDRYRMRHLGKKREWYAIFSDGFRRLAPIDYVLAVARAYTINPVDGST